MNHLEGKANNRQVRCDCGRLYLVKTKDGYEFKCPRCKRIHLIKYEDLIVDYLTKEEKDVSVATI